MSVLYCTKCDRYIDFDQRDECPVLSEDSVCEFFPDEPLQTEGPSETPGGN